MNNIISTTKRYCYHTLTVFVFGVFLLPAISFAAQSPAVVTGVSSSTGGSSVQILGRSDTGGDVSAQVWFEWGTSVSLGNTTGSQTISTNTNIVEYLSGLSSNTKYYYRIAAKNSHGTSYGEIKTLTVSENLSAVLPLIATRSATDVTNTSAAMNGYVDPLGNTGTQTWFEWGYSMSLGNTTPIVNREESAYFGFTIGGLNVNTTYYYRAVAQNSRGTTKGTIMNFKTTSLNPQTSPVYPVTVTIPIQSGTVPIVITHLAENILQTSAELKGLALPGSTISTDGWFEFGKTAALGNQTARKNIGFSTSIDFSETLSGLSPNTLYYYRAVIQNQKGASSGNVLSFRTAMPLSYTPSVVSIQPKEAPKEQESPKVDDKNKEEQTAASLFVGGKFFPDTLIEWLLLIILIFILIAISNHLYGVHKKRKEEKKKRLEEEGVENK